MYKLIKKQQIVIILLLTTLVISIIVFLINKQSIKEENIQIQTIEEVIQPTTIEESETVTIDNPNPATTSSTTTSVTRNDTVKPINTPTIPSITPKPDVTASAPVARSLEIIPAFNSSEMLSAHNKIRAEVGVPKLSWSTELAKSAEVWSQTLKAEGCKMRHDYNTDYGENIYWQQQSGGDISDLISSPTTAVTWWAAEESNYNYDKNTCTKGEQCGHYTQIVWSDTTDVGCGVSSCTLNNKRTDIWVCRYNPGGNIIGLRPY
jgi:uncharacterized protein YkwD